MKKLIILTLAVVISAVVSAQSLSPVVTPSAGGYFTGGGNSLSWTMGETFNTTLQSANNMLTQGEQQPYIILKILNLRAFIEGFYVSGGQMQAVLYNNNPFLFPPTYCDSITVALHEASSPYNFVVSKHSILLTDGTALVQLPASLNNGAYYIVLHHHNSIETWSKLPVMFGNNTSFDFTVQ